MAAEAFLNAILATPDDDTPRLVYADWLDDHGESARAEFIRVQIEHAQRPRPDLAERSRQLLDEHRGKWIIPNLRGVQEFHRGFVDSLQILAEDFVANADRIGRLAPVTNLRLPVAVEHLTALADVPWISRLRHLDLTGNVGIGSRLDEFFGTVELPKLRSLELRNCQLWAENIGVLGQLANRWPLVRRLNLSGNPLSDDGIERLANATSFEKLHELVLRCDGQQYVDAIHAAGATALGHSKFRQLHTLDLNGQSIGDTGVESLAMAPLWQTVDHLNLAYNDIGIEITYCFTTLFDANALPNLKTLILDGNMVEPISVDRLLVWPRLQSLDSVSLLDCDLHPDDITRMKASVLSDKFILDEVLEHV